MKTNMITSVLLGSTLLLGSLAACTASGPERQRMHQASSAASMSGDGRHTGGAMPMNRGDMAAMCMSIHDKLRSANSSEERAAIMQEHMKSMTPEMRAKMHAHMHSMPEAERARMCMGQR